MSQVVLFAYSIKVNISTRNGVTKMLQRSYNMISSYLFNAISFYRLFNNLSYPTNPTRPHSIIVYYYLLKIIQKF